MKMTDNESSPQKDKDSGSTLEAHPSKFERKLLMKFLVPGLVIITLCLAAFQVIKSTSRSDDNSIKPGEVAKLETGERLQDFDLHLLDGKSVTASKLGAKVLLLNFWATWCEACMVEMPSIIELQKLYKNKGLEVAAIDLDDEPQTAAPKVIKKLGFNFPVYSDADGVLAGFFDIRAIPLTILVDKDLKILLVENSGRDWLSTGFKSELEKWLKQ